MHSIDIVAVQPAAIAELMQPARGIVVFVTATPGGASRFPLLGLPDCMRSAETAGDRGLQIPGMH